MLAAPTAAPQVRLPSAPGSQPPQTPEQPFKRPEKFIGLLSDLSRNRKEGYTFLIVACGLLITVTICFAAGCWAIFEAAKGFKGFPLRAVLAGIPSASILTLLTSRIVRWIKKIKSGGGPSSG
jgi:hypothetical protein